MIDKCKKQISHMLESAKNDPKNAVYFCLYFFTPFICFWMVEILNEYNPFTDLAPWQWSINLAWYYWFLLLGWLVFGRKTRAMGFALIVSFIFGLANHYVLEFRGRALFPVDVLSITTARNVAAGYDYTPDIYVWAALAVLIVSLLLLIPFREKKGGDKKEALGKKLRGRIAAAILLAAFAGLYFFSPLLDMAEIRTQQWRTQSNGFMMNFMTSLAYMHVSEPDGYSEDEVIKMIAGMEGSDPIGSTAANSPAPAENTEAAKSSAPADNTEAKDPAGSLDPAGSARPAGSEGPVTNFVIIMNESFADMTEFEDLTLSDDPMPYFHSLRENIIKGDMIAPVTGGGTATVEFEALTGCNDYFLPEDTVAYQLYLSDDFPSLAWEGNALGAHTSAYHPYLASGWNRTNAYRQLGFRSQYYLDQIIDGSAFSTEYSKDELVREYVSDEADYKRLFAVTDEAKKEGKNCFVFNVTMQNHSGYTKAWTNLERSVTLSGDYRGNGYDQSSGQYLSLIRESDKALKTLLEHYEKVDEPTVILFFGDHQPPLSNDLYKKIYGKKLEDRSTEEIMEQHRTPFMIWANFDIPEKDDLVIGSSFLGVYASRIAGYPQTGWMKFLSSVNETFAAVTEAGIVLADGTIAGSEDELTSEQQETLRQYEQLQYYNMFGDEKKKGSRERAFFLYD